MQIIGIIAEYNPFHNGHLYHIQKIKEQFPDSLTILVLNGYFLQRGEISILSKETKTRLALEYGVDLVVLLPFVFGTQAADIFAARAIEILNHFRVTDIVFGSEMDDIKKIKSLAESQLNEEFDKRLKIELKKGINYPTALSLALQKDYIIKEPNDLLGISYAKAILKNDYKINLHTIKRTSDYHDTKGNDNIVSASNIRKKVQEGFDITHFVPNGVIEEIININYDKVWEMLKYRIITDPDLSRYMTVDEGIENRLKKQVGISNNLEEFINNIKTKRYTYNKIRRMIIHILVGFTKEMNENLVLDYLQVLGFNMSGKAYLSHIRKDLKLALKPPRFSFVYQIEQNAAFLYEIFTNCSVKNFELQRKPVQIGANSNFDKVNTFSYNDTRK